MSNKDSIAWTVWNAAVGYTFLYGCFYVATDMFAKYRLSKTNSTTMKHYENLSQEHKCMYVSYMISTVNAIYCVALFITSVSSCEPPEKYSKSNIKLGNTFLRNDWCLDNPNIQEVRVTMYFLGYLIHDTLVVLFLIKDTKSAASRQILLHHFVAAIGCAGNLLIGRYVTTISCAFMLTELSTPFINLRWFLATHNKTDSVLYFWNGITFTFVFFVARNVLQTWITIKLLIPAFIRDNFARNDSIILQMSIYACLVFYLLLLGLNYYWFTRIISGAIKHLGKPKKVREKDQ